MKPSYEDLKNFVEAVEKRTDFNHNLYRLLDVLSIITIQLFRYEQVHQRVPHWGMVKESPLIKLFTKMMIIVNDRIRTGKWPENFEVTTADLSPSLPATFVNMADDAEREFKDTKAIGNKYRFS